MASQKTQLGLGVLAATVVGVGAVLLGQSQQDTPLIAASAPAQSRTDAPAPDPVETIAKPGVPQFDTFRVEGDGLFVIAGKALPGQAVDVMLSGAAVQQVVADAQGSFGAVLMLPPSNTPRRLGLLADPKGAAVASTQTFLIEPFSAGPTPDKGRAAPVVVGAVTPQGAEAVNATLDIAAPAAPDVPQSSESPAATSDSATVLVADADGVRVVANDADLPPELTANIALDTITYDPAGAVEIAGRASGQGHVQVYIDNQPITTSRIRDGGGWQTDLPQVDTGVYTLRVDEVDTQGAVVSRIETPFKREDQATVAAVLAEETASETFDVAVRTVQPGATLWAIAQEELGSGVLYVAVYEANRDLIRDPDLIYPGQVFRVPETGE